MSPTFDEKRVVVLPVLVEDCEIPLFLREKMYADLRKDFESGLHSILNAIAKVTNTYQGRIEGQDGYSDWAEDWGYTDGLFYLRITIISSGSSIPMTFLTEIFVFCNEVATHRYRQYEEAGLDWIGRSVIAEALFDFGAQDDYRLILDSQFPQKLEATITDPKIGAQYDVLVVARKLGQDNGKDQLIDIGDHLKSVRDYIRSVSRQPNEEELRVIREIRTKSWHA